MVRRRRRRRSGSRGREGLLFDLMSVLDTGLGLGGVLGILLLSVVVVAPAGCGVMMLLA